MGNPDDLPEELVLRKARKLFEPNEDLTYVYADGNRHHPLVVAFGNRVIARFKSRADADQIAPYREVIDVGRGRTWRDALANAEHNLREGKVRLP